MDMNEILSKWDDFQKKEKQKQKEISKIQVSHKKANAPTKEEKLLEKNKSLDYKIQKENSKKNKPNGTLPSPLRNNRQRQNTSGRKRT